MQGHKLVVWGGAHNREYRLPLEIDGVFTVDRVHTIGPWMTENGRALFRLGLGFFW